MGDVLSKYCGSDSNPVEIDLEFNISCCGGHTTVYDHSDSEDDAMGAAAPAAPAVCSGPAK